MTRFRALERPAALLALAVLLALLAPSPVAPAAAAEGVELEPYLELVEEVAAACARSLREAGVDLDAYTTEDSVADLEALRRALGAERIDLLGISYGSHLAMAYLRAHPERVRRVVLAGLEGPDHTIKLPSQFDRQLDALDDLVAAEGASGESFQESVEEILDRLERQPVTVRLVKLEGPDREGRMVIGRRELAAVTMRRLQDPGGMVQLPALYRRLAAGDFTDVASEVLDLRSLGGLEAMPEAMDGASGISPARLERLRREDGTTLLGSGVLLADLATARGLGVRDLGEAFRGPLTVDVPALLISGSLDGRTPASNAEELLPGFPNGRHLVVRNGGHGDDLLVATPELGEEIVGFLLGREPGRREIAVPPPDPAASRRRMPLTPEQAARYVGEYERRDREIWRILHHETIETLDAEGEVTHASAVLQIRWAGNGFPLLPVTEESFYVDFPSLADHDFTFVFDDSGAVSEMVINPGRADEIRLPKVH
jgi:pimeloyl-ACP methyl ester carboxylesterase